MALNMLKVTELFLDRVKVLEAADKGKVKALSKIGAFVWRRAKSSIKIKKGTAPAGSPPYGHTTTTRKKTNKKTGVTKVQPASPLREFIFFSYDPSTKSVVVGPIPLGDRAGPMALKALEMGGPSIGQFRGKKRTISIAAHPFMGPAMEAEVAKMPEAFRDMIR